MRRVILVSLIIFICENSFGQISFTNVTAGSGAPNCHTWFFQYIDYNNDNYPDFFVKDPNTHVFSLYKNNGDFTFSDVTSPSGFSLAASDQLGNNNFQVADFNKDGWQDVLTYDFANHKLLFLLNQNGVFSDQSVAYTIPQDFLPAAVNVEGFSTTVADFDGNGFLDFAFGKNDATSHKQTVYCLFNSGTSLSSPVELFHNTIAEHKFILQAIDYDLDGDEDLLVLDSDFSIYWSGQYYNHPMKFFKNTAGVFTETTLPGLGTSNQDDFGLVWDYNNDGYPDFTSGTPDYVANEASIAKTYRNNGGLSLTDVTSEIQINQGGGQYILFNSCLDIDQDGDQDYIGEGSVFLNNLTGAFTPSPSLSAAVLGLRHRTNPADLDNDGDLDIITLADNEGIRVIKNNSTGTHFLKIKLMGTQSPKEGQGAFVKVKTGSQTQFRHFYSNRLGVGASSASAKDIFFGLGANTSVDSVTVYWPSGEVSRLGNVISNQILAITEPEGQPLNQNYSLSFNGSSSKINIPASTSQEIFGANQPSTLSLWVKFNRVDVEQTLFFKGIVSGNPELGNKYYGLSLQQPGYHRLSFSLYNGGTLNDVYSSPSLSVEPNVWYNVVVVRSAEIKMFVNGVDVSSGSNNAGWNTDYNSILSDKDIYLGTTHSTDPDYSFLDGKLEDVQLWSKALTQSEIQENMSSVLTGNEANLVGHWNFNEGTELVVLDKTTNHNDGTNSGAFYSSDVPHPAEIPSIPSYIPTNGLVAWYPFNGNANDESGNTNNGNVSGSVLSADRNGNQNSAYSFDGVANYISFPQRFEFNQTGDATISLWLKPNLPPNGSQGTFLYSRISESDANRYNFFLNNKTQNSVYITFDYRESNINQHVLNTYDNLATNTWVNVLLTRTGNTYTLFLNNQLINTFQDNSPNIPTEIGWLLGNDPTSGFDYSGLIDDIGMWNRALTQQEITQLYYGDSTPPETVTDIDGNVYNTVKIGNQIWTTSNLKVTKYNDGTSIPNITNDGDWVNTQFGSFCAYNNDQNNVPTYGYLYNWYAVNNGKLAPEGWHVATDEEWTELVNFTGGSSSAYEKLRSEFGWVDSGTNDFGFTAIPSGYRSGGNGSFTAQNVVSYWWTATENDVLSSWERYTDQQTLLLERYSDSKKYGFSVRLVKDSIPPLTVTDIDGNVYNTVKIGNQIWTTSNLKVTKYNDGTSIPNLTDGSQWGTTTTGAYCAFNNDQNNVTTYGYLYNWYAVNTGKLAPEGWHVPSDAEWTELTDYLGGASSAATQLKASSEWSNNGNGTDDYGFAAFPGGYRLENSNFFDLGLYGTWWSSSVLDASNAWHRNIDYNDTHVWRYNSPIGRGFSVRLVKDVVDTATTTVWRMQIKGSISGSQDFENFAGVSITAKNIFDTSFDTPEPPTNPGNYISVYFPHPEWNNLLGNNFTNDIRTNSDLSDSVSRWYFEVKSNVLNQDVTLNFQNDRIPKGYGRYLTDLQTHQRINLSSQSTFTYSNTAETPRKFILVIGDSTSPSLSILSPKNGTIWQSGKTKTLNWSGTDGTGIDSVKVYYSPNGTVFNLISSAGNQTTFDWTVPSHTLNHLNKIKVVAIDSVGNQKAITSPFFTISGDSLVTTVSAGWNLLSLPLEPNDSSKSKIVGDDFGSAPYFLWTYSGQNGYQEAQFLHSGTGFWLGALSAKTVDVTGSVLEADSIIQQLTPGYNLIGNQFVKAIAKSNLFILANGVEYSFASAIDNNLIGSVIYGFDGTTYQESDTLSLFKGYWILALTDQLSLVQKVKVGSVPIAKRLAKTSEMQESDWMMDIAISSAGKTYQPVTFGTNLAATENFDNAFDNPLPPKSPAANYVDSWFELAGSYPEIIGNRFKRDITDNLSLSWSLNVETNQAGSYTLSWNPEVALSDPYLISLSLKNMSNDEIIDMRAETEYTTEITGSVTFSIIGVTNSSTVPVELVSFTGENSGRKTILTWQTKSETNNSGWEVERKTVNNPPTGSTSSATGQWEKLGFIAGKGTTSEPSSYSFSALGVAKSSLFRLKQIDLDGKYTYSKSIEVEGVKIEEFKLYQNYPNPFNPTTVISFNLAKAEKVELKVFDMLGREVRTLINNESKSEGLHQITFDASTLSNGIYFYQITAGSFKQNKKMLLLK